jgi:hypothetical protein
VASIPTNESVDEDDEEYIMDKNPVISLWYLIFLIILQVSHWIFTFRNFFHSNTGCQRNGTSIFLAPVSQGGKTQTEVIYFSRKGLRANLEVCGVVCEIDFIFRYPQKKIKKLIGLFSSEGAGKGVLMKTLFSLIGEANSCTIQGTKHLCKYVCLTIFEFLGLMPT